MTTLPLPTITLDNLYSTLQFAPNHQPNPVSLLSFTPVVFASSCNFFCEGKQSQSNQNGKKKDSLHVHLFWGKIESQYSILQNFPYFFMGLRTCILLFGRSEGAKRQFSKFNSSCLLFDYHYICFRQLMMTAIRQGRCCLHCCRGLR